jgi:hypothetical protein
MESLMRLREPAAWVALGALVLNLVLAIVAIAINQGPLANVAVGLSARAANPVPLVVLAVLVTFCVVRERTPHARLLTLALWALAAEPIPVIGVLTAILIQATSVIAVVLLIKLFRLQAVPRRLPAGIGLAPYLEQVPVPQPADQRLQPTWQPDTAAGAVWRTAGEAAAGAPATGWGVDSSTGWQPIPTQPTEPQPNGPQPNGPMPQGAIPGDQAISKGQRDVQPPEVDWWGRPQS